MRKYDVRNKRNIGIIIIISIIIIIMFSLFIKLLLHKDRNEYPVEDKTIVFDVNRNIIRAKENAIIKTKWNKKYYLIEGKNNYELGSTSITYNESTGEIKLYGRYYEISSGDEINITSGETTIKNSTLTKFYKLEDRKYLVVDKTIKTSDGLLSTDDFLLIDIDKVGNATFTNHKVNLKSFSASTIVTSNYTFDIANEILSYGSEKIDLKKIIGSTNNYKKGDLEPTENNENQSVSLQDSTSGNEEADDSGTNKKNVVIEEVKKASKQTSVISVNGEINKIRIDYVVYDPHNEYASVYMEVQKEGTNTIDTIHLDSKATSYDLTKDIFPNTKYNLTFKYNYLNENNEMETKTFDKVTVTTKKPSVSIKVTKTSLNNITYLITSDSAVSITSGMLKTYVNGTLYKEETVNINGNTVGSIYINDLSNNDLVELKLTDVKVGETVIKDVSSSYKFKY